MWFSIVFLCASKGIQGWFEGVSRVLHGHLIGVSRVFYKCFIGISRVLQDNLRVVPKVFQGYVMGVSWMLPKPSFSLFMSKNGIFCT